MNEENKVILIKIDDIIPNRFQPREIFDEDSLQELSDSIKEHGVIQPIIVRKLGDKYELIAGERRTKASALAGKTTIPAIVREMDDKESAKISLLENLQRKNLSSIEEAKTYKKILELENMTQEELARTMGRSQPMVANKLRLLSLPEEIQEALMKNQISERHARSLLTIQDKKDQLKFLDRIRNERLTVRELDSEIKKYKEEKQETKTNEEKDEERFMNNNRSNFGGMGLNDYQSSVNGNMFNNFPNNFNNVPVNNEIANSAVNNSDYNNVGVSLDSSNSFNNQNIMSNDMNNNFQTMNSNSQSLGSMFDNNQNFGMNNSMVNNDESNNLLISNIKEDNVPPKENQFLPNFDEPMQNNNFDYNFTDNSMNQQSNNNDMTYLNSQFAPTNFPEPNNYNQSMNMMPNNQINNGEQFIPDNNYMGNSPINQNSYNQPIQNMNLNTPLPTPQQTPMGNFDFYGNPVSNPQEAYQPNLMNNMNNNSINNDFAMNNIDQYNKYNMQNGNNIPDFATNNNTNINQYNMNSNNGGLFNQPLNIVGPYGDNSNETMPLETSLPVNNEINVGPNINSNENNIEQPIEQTNNFEPEIENSVPPTDEIPNIPDIEVIGDNDVPLSVNDNSIEQKEEEKNDYIRLEEEITIHNVRDAVLELKKTTDKIKQNHINIETEEIEFDDVYQIVIKLKKEEN